MSKGVWGFILFIIAFSLVGCGGNEAINKEEEIEKITGFSDE